MIDSTLPGIIKERILKRKFHMTKEELPKVLFNLDKDSLYILEFVLNMYKKGFGEIDSNEIFDYVSRHHFMKLRRYHYKKEKLVKDKILIKVKNKSKYYLDSLVREFYNKIFTEQEKLKIFAATPNKYHFIYSFIVKIPKKSFTETALSKFLERMASNSYVLGGITYRKKQKKSDPKAIEDISYYYEPLILLYHLMAGMTYIDEDDLNYFYDLNSDIHISSENREYTKIERVLKKVGKKKTKNINKIVAESVCFTHTLSIFWFLYSIMGATLYQIEKFGPKEIK